MKAAFNDHIVTTRAVYTETGKLAPAGTHGFVVRALEDPNERYVAELYLADPSGVDTDELGVLHPNDFEVT